MAVRWTTYATNDLVAIREHIARDSVQYADVVADRILNRVNQLRTFPESGSIVPEYRRDDIREIFVHSYRIVYQVLDGEVHILTVFHGANPLRNSLSDSR